MIENLKIVAKYPETGVLIDIKDPLGNSVLIVPAQEFMAHHTQRSHPVYRQFCTIIDDKIVAAEGFTHNTLIPVTMPDFSWAKQCEAKEGKWK